MAHGAYRPPTAAEKTDIDKISAELARVIGIYGLHPKVQAGLAVAGYTTIDMLSGCYAKEGDLIDEAPEEFGFAIGEIAQEKDAAAGIVEVKFIKAMSKTERVRLALIWNHCLNTRKKKATILTQSASPEELKGLVTSGPLPSGQAVWHRKHQEAAQLIYTGTDHFLGIIYKDIATGPIGVYSWKQRTGALDMNLIKRNIQRKDGQSTIKDDEYEEAPLPASFAEAKQRTHILTQSITLMCYALPSVGLVNTITRSDLEDHYEWFWGPELAGAAPAPSLQVLMDVDILYWKKVAILMHKHTTLKEALKEARGDHLFWTREVIQKTPPIQGGGQAQASQQPSQQQPYWPPQAQPSWQNWPPYGKGKGKKGKGKGKGKGKKGGKPGGPPQLAPIPQNILNEMATMTPASPKYPSGQAICKNFVLGTCQGWCGRAHHLCPRKLPSGYCFGHHTLRACIQQTPP